MLTLRMTILVQNNACSAMAMTEHAFNVVKCDVLTLILQVGFLQREG